VHAAFILLFAYPNTVVCHLDTESVCCRVNDDILTGCAVSQGADRVAWLGLVRSVH